MKIKATIMNKKKLSFFILTHRQKTGAIGAGNLAIESHDWKRWKIFLENSSK